MVKSMFKVIVFGVVLSVHCAQAFTFGSTTSHVEVGTVSELEALFHNHDYTLQKDSVPRLFLASFPSDYKAVNNKPVSEKKSLFVQTLLPMILSVNESILKDRERLLGFKERLAAGGHLRTAEKKWMMQLSERYKLKTHSLDDLLIRVDVIPSSLALAQSSLESGWGLSRAAREDNSTFGHMATLTKVETFNSLYRNVEAYIHNLNCHMAYKELRSERARMRAQEQDICSIKLASIGLKRYSVRGHAYINDVKKMIQQNGFKRYDSVTLKV